MERAMELERRRGGRPTPVPGSLTSPLVPIRPARGGPRPLLVLVHPVGGSITAYHRLARCLDGGQPVYAIENQVAMNPHTHSYSSVETMATDYLNLLAALPTEPRLVLAGYSMGGLVAFEMALQRAAVDDRVGLVIIIDTPAAVAASQVGQVEEMTAQDVLTMGTVIAGPLGIDLRLDIGRLEAAAPDQRVDQLITALRRHEVLAGDVDIALFHRLVRAIKANDLAQRLYQPRKYAGDVTLVRAEERFDVLADEAGALYDDPMFGWQKYCARPVQLRTAAGSHLRIFDGPYVGSLAAAVQQAVDAVGDSPRVKAVT
jgi:thioesterase domain-containing protein